MPWHVRKTKDKWAIVNSLTSEVVGFSDTKEKAEASVKARYANYKGFKKR